MGGDAGSVTAEAAVVLPVLLVVTLLLAGLLGLLSAAIGVDEAARAAAREIARGGSAQSLQADVQRRWPGASLSSRRESDLVVVEVRRPLSWPGLFGRAAPVREVVGEAAVASEPGWAGSP